MDGKLRFWIRGGIIAAIYIVLSFVFKPFGFGYIQVRIAEALCILPFFTTAAVPGLFVGCVLSNLLFSEFSVIDMAVGGLATLIAAVITSRIKKEWAAPLPAVLINAVAVGIMLSKLMNVPWAITCSTVFAGQAVACYGLGMPLLFALKKYKIFEERR